MSELEMKVEALIRCVPQDLWEKAIADVSNGKTIEKRSLYATIRETLHDVGMPSHVLGFEHSVCSIALLYDNPGLVRYFYKGLYTEVANKVGSTPTRVERNIRHAIEVAWSRYGSEMRDTYFNAISNPSKANPMTVEFLIGMTEIVRQKMR